MTLLRTWFHSPDQLGPWVLVMLFLAASLLMIWRLEHLTQSGFEGTVLGTLVMPYCSGVGNLIFVFLVYSRRLPGAEVVTNCLVNNVTNMTLLMGLPAIVWGTRLFGRARAAAKKKRKAEETQRLNRLSILLTLTAVLFFTGAVWALGGDRRLDAGDGLVLVGLFLFWQCFHIFEVLKDNVRQNRSLRATLALDFLLLLAGGGLVYFSLQGLVVWLGRLSTGFVSARNLGWLSGWLLVLPNAMLAMYYGWKRRPEVIYTSQVGDGHICIPLCVGLSAWLQPMTMPPVFHTGALVLTVAVIVHMMVVAILGQLPRLMGWLLAGAYAFFLYRGLIR